jgi:UDP-N-acetylmuramoyl-tripeptide--D-alanyl-D-alanine ligase
MGFAEPFPGYSMVLRAILFGFVPAFFVWQVFRLRRALHVFQLEGYKRRRFLGWCKSHPREAVSLALRAHKRPLAMTGRAWRILVAATLLSAALVLGASAAAHLAGGWPYDVSTWLLSTSATLVAAPLLVVASDWLLTPVQSAVNARYLSAAKRKLRDVAPTVIGVTGSFGKTSTKFAVARLVGSDDDVLATPASFNTPLGVCRAINEQLRPSHRFLVVEMGAHAEGDVRELCELVRPSIGVLTAVGPAHLERFGSMEAVRRTKYELVEALPRDGVAIMNCDDDEVRALADRTPTPVVRYGLRPEARADITADDVRVTGSGMSLRIVDTRSGDRLEASTRLLGAHAAGHILAAVAVATAVGRRLTDLGEAVAALRPVEHRLQILEGTGEVTVIDDAYNSNPSGAAVALEVLGAMPGRNKVVVTPGMVELGDAQFEANRRLGEQAARVADALIVVARVNRDAITSGALRAGDGARVIAVDSLAQAQEELEKLLRAGDVVLFENDLPDHLEV